MLDRLGLPEAPRQIYENAPLAAVICQIRFPRTLSVSSPQSMAKFQRAIQNRYPHLEEAREARISVDLGGSAPEISQTPVTPVTRWQFSDIGKDWIVVLAQDFLALEGRKYDRFETFVERLKEALVPLARYIQPVGVERIGLRYINEVRLSGYNLGDVIRPEPLGLLGVSMFGRYIRQAMREEVMDLGEGQAVQVRHGFFPGGSTVLPRPGETMHGDNEPFYLLDLDVSHTFTTPLPLGSKYSSVIPSVVEYHDVIHRLFHWFVKDDFLQRLRTVGNDDRDL